MQICFWALSSAYCVLQGLELRFWPIYLIVSKHPVVQLVDSLSVVLPYILCYRCIVIMGMFPYRQIFWFQLLIYLLLILSDSCLCATLISFLFHCLDTSAQSCHSSPLSGHCPQNYEQHEYLKNWSVKTQSSSDIITKRLCYYNGYEKFSSTRGICSIILHTMEVRHTGQ